jgi:hypothetical protein
MMVDIKVIPAIADHIPYLADHMRVADVSEVLAMSGRKPFDALDRSLSSSDVCFTATCDDVPMCMFGVGTVNMLSRVGVPWLLGTDDVEKHYRPFSRGSVFWRDYMTARYDLLINAVDTRNTMSMRWLKWLGFTLHEAMPMGVSKIPFHPFELRSAHV